jgi:hypothetical protein
MHAVGIETTPEYSGVQLQQQGVGSAYELRLHACGCRSRQVDRHAFKQQSHVAHAGVDYSGLE